MLNSYKREHLTKPWITTIFVVVIVISFLITWLLIGDFNALHQQWLIPYGGTLWKGTLTQDNHTFLYDTYKEYMNQADANKLNDPQYFDKSIRLISNQPIFNYLFLIVLFSIVIVLIGSFIILKLFKLINIDALTFIITFSIVGFVFNICGIIPENWSTTGYWIIRLVITVVTLVIVFFITNRIINYLIATSSLGNQAINDIIDISATQAETKQTINKLSDQYKNQDKITYVELGKEDK